MEMASFLKFGMQNPEWRIRIQYFSFASYGLYPKGIPKSTPPPWQTNSSERQKILTVP
jgi:hypothetical protein